MNTLSERIRKHRDELGLTQNELSRRLGCRSRSSINKILAFAAALDVSPSYLMGWKDDMPEPIRTICIPVFGKMPAGVPIDAIENILYWEELDPQRFAPDNDYFGLVVRGDSMSPVYLEGDVIIVQQSEDAVSGKDVAVYVNGYGATLKRLYKYENRSVELRPLNHNYESRTYSAKEVESVPVVICGIVKEIRRKV